MLRHLIVVAALVSSIGACGPPNSPPAASAQSVEKATPAEVLTGSGSTSTGSGGERSYATVPTTLRDLLEKLPTVVAVEPQGDERLIWELDGAEVYATEARVLRTFKGDLAVGDIITILRQGAAGMSEDDVDTPSFSSPMYILGLADTEGFYGEEAYDVIGGPYARIPFDGTTEQARVVAERDVGMQHELRGTTYEEVRERLQRS